MRTWRRVGPMPRDAAGNTLPIAIRRGRPTPRPLAWLDHYTNTEPYVPPIPLDLPVPVVVDIHLDDLPLSAPAKTVVEWV